MSAESIWQMAFIGRLHPLLIHFPIALVIVAVAAEGLATVTDDSAGARWPSATFAPAPHSP